MKRWRLSPFILCTFIMLSGVACQNAKPAPEQAALRFMENYYGRADLQEALKDADGFAQVRIQQSIQLTSGQPADKSSFHPKTTYTLVESELEGDEARYVFRVLIEPEKTSAIRKKTQVKLRKRTDGAWKVTQFSDQDE